MIVLLGLQLENNDLSFGKLPWIFYCLGAIIHMWPVEKRYYPVKK
jgi:hypothetical protein